MSTHPLTHVARELARYLAPVLCLLLEACASPGAEAGAGTDADTPDDLAATSRLAARVHFAEGWTAIMDEGRWTVAEAAFRTAAEADPDWVLGRTLVGRVTTDLAEREEILAWVEARLPGVDPTSRLLVDVYVLNLRAANLRDRGEALPAGFREEREQLALRNFRAYLERFPKDAYVSAELVEWVHAADGAAAALTAMDEEVDPQARTVPFFLGYRATLLAELGRFEEAHAAAAEYADALNDPMAPGPYVTLAHVLLQEGRLGEAAEQAQVALGLDEANLSARGVADTVAASRATDA